MKTPQPYKDTKVTGIVGKGKTWLTMLKVIEDAQRGKRVDK